MNAAINFVTEHLKAAFSSSKRAKGDRPRSAREQPKDDVLTLSARDSRAVAEMVIDPPALNGGLRKVIEEKYS